MHGQVQGVTTAGKELDSRVSLQMQLQPRFVVVPDRIAIPSTLTGENDPVRIIVRSMIDDLPDSAAINLKLALRLPKPTAESKITNTAEILLNENWERVSAKTWIFKGVFQIPRQCEPGLHTGELILNCKTANFVLDTRIPVEIQVNASQD